MLIALADSNLSPTRPLPDSAKNSTVAGNQSPRI